MLAKLRIGNLRERWVMEAEGDTTWQDEGGSGYAFFKRSKLIPPQHIRDGEGKDWCDQLQRGAKGSRGYLGTMTMTVSMVYAGVARGGSDSLRRTAFQMLLELWLLAHSTGTVARLGSASVRKDVIATRLEN